VIELDDINRDIIDLLQDDARLSYRELGERIGLSAPAVAERVRKLEEVGVITGYRAVVDYEALGFPLLCIIRLNANLADRTLDEVLGQLPEVIEANRVTGSESHVLRARVRSTEHLERLLERLWEHGNSVTNIVTSSPVPRRAMSVRQALAEVPTPSRRVRATATVPLTSSRRP
jgi:Lrp/AsnC family leucine-responsive transcriptional regulator